MSPLLRGRGSPVIATVVGVLAFALGLGAGVAIILLTGTSGNGRPEVAVVPTSPSPAPRALPSSSGRASAGAVTPDAACLSALSAAQTVSDDVQGIAKAARALNAAALDRIIQQLQKVRPDLVHNLSACHAVVTLPSQLITPSPSPVSVSPAPATSPSLLP